MPPSAKALNWFCSQPESSSVYPLFFVSKSSEDPDPKLLYLKETKGVFGIGASVYFTKTSSSTSGERSEFKRFSFVILSSGNHFSFSISLLVFFQL